MHINKKIIDHKGSLANLFQKNKPCKHIVIDDFFKHSLAERLYNNFPDINSSLWLIDENNKIKYAKDNPFERKLIAISDKSKFPSCFLKIFKYLDSIEFIDFIECVTGLKSLMPDETGIHTGLRGMIDNSYQMIHSDAVMNPISGLEKRLTLIVYLNKHWEENTGGNLEFWDDDRKVCMSKIEPIFNRLVIFECTEKSYHGVPEVIKMKDPHNIRKSIMWSYVCKPQKNNSKRKRAKFVSTSNNKFSKDMEELSLQRSKINTEAKFRF